MNTRSFLSQVPFPSNQIRQSSIQSPMSLNGPSDCVSVEGMHACMPGSLGS